MRFKVLDCATCCGETFWASQSQIRLPGQASQDILCNLSDNVLASLSFSGSLLACPSVAPEANVRIPPTVWLQFSRYLYSLVPLRLILCFSSSTVRRIRQNQRFHKDMSKSQTTWFPSAASFCLSLPRQPPQPKIGSPLHDFKIPYIHGA